MKETRPFAWRHGYAPRPPLLAALSDHEDVPQRLGEDYARTLGLFLEGTRVAP